MPSPLSTHIQLVGHRLEEDGGGRHTLDVGHVAVRETGREEGEGCRGVLWPDSCQAPEACPETWLQAYPTRLALEQGSSLTPRK